MNESNPMPERQPSSPSFSEALHFWMKLGFISFGGPTGQIAIMHSELVEKKKWISESRFLHALNYCMLLPGPEAQQLATYVGWLLHKTAGGIVAGALFVLPSVFILWMLSFAYVVHGKLDWVAAIFYGLKPAVVAIVACAVIRIGKKALKNEIMWILALSAFVAIFFFKMPFPLIMLTAGALGFTGGKIWPQKFLATANHGTKNSSSPSVVRDEDESPLHTRPTLRRAMRVCVIALILWWLPVFALGWWQGWDSTFFKQGIFFSKAAMVTFGGAYAVLPYVAQRAVMDYQWLSAPQMLDGLGLAETTPGPLIMVLQFVGFVGGWNHPGNLSPLLAAALGALITTWATFLPCFMWIFVGAPHIEALRGNRNLTAALSSITAAVVGVVLNLAIWFGLHILFPRTGALDWFAAVVGVIAFVGMMKWNWNIVVVILGAGLLGLLFSLFKLRFI
ncbi:MAG TPA: chromate efflux transporter [bacterium]